MHFTNKLVLGSALLMSQVSFAHGPKPMPLIGVPVPPVPGLLDGPDPIVVNKDKAIALGKALFWDMNVGSDGIACGSCHFNAGADHRVKNQLNPGDMGTLETANSFETMASGLPGGPNHTLNKEDFPFYQFNNPLSQASGINHETDDVMASSGTFSGEFAGASRFSGNSDNCSRSADPVFNVNHVGTRRVEPRNAPTMINAVFNHRNFWDGRANNVFNGSSNWGDRDPDAGVWVKQSARRVVKQRLHLINSSLASQAVATVQSLTEMACNGRNLADLGRKLLSRQPLQHQKVHEEDSVFAPQNLILGSDQKGLNTTYGALVRAAFNPKYWSYSRRGAFGSPVNGGMAYDQMEANFSMFFSLALQVYESTLISDQAPIDLSPRDPVTMEPTYEGMGYTEEEVVSLKNGLHRFEANHCNICHAGPLLTNVAIAANTAIVTPIPGKFYGPDHFKIPFGILGLGPKVPGFLSAAQEGGMTPHGNIVAREGTLGGVKLADFGFANTGVGDPENDPGLGGVDDFGHPLSFAEQYKQYLMGNNEALVDADIDQQKVCDFRNEFALNFSFPDSGLFTALDGLQQDGARQGQLRNQNCLKEPSLYAFIPTPEAAIAAKDLPKMAVSTKANFKVPTLRNIELTGPFMHNGSMSTLEEVVEFYARNGNNKNPDQNSFVSAITLSSNVPATIQARKDIVAFLKTLTDERVRYKKAPFDHPEIIVPHGHIGDEAFVDAENPLGVDLAKDEFLVIPAVGANGQIDPVLPFEAHLPD